MACGSTQVPYLISSPEFVPAGVQPSLLSSGPLQVPGFSSCSQLQEGWRGNPKPPHLLASFLLPWLAPGVSPLG